MVSFNGCSIYSQSYCSVVWMLSGEVCRVCACEAKFKENVRETWENGDVLMYAYLIKKLKYLDH